jgi:hypothetical protein
VDNLWISVFLEQIRRIFTTYFSENTEKYEARKMLILLDIFVFAPKIQKIRPPYRRISPFRGNTVRDTRGGGVQVACE